MNKRAFTTILRTLQSSMGNHVLRPVLHGMMLFLMWRRVSDMMRQFEALLANWRAGMMPDPLPAHAEKPHTTPRATAPRPPHGRDLPLAPCRMPAAPAQPPVALPEHQAKNAPFLRRHAVARPHPAPPEPDARLAAAQARPDTPDSAPRGSQARAPPGKKTKTWHGSIATISLRNQN